MEIVKKIIPHICIILAIVTLTLLILDFYNPWILDTDFFKVIIYAFFGVVLITSGLLIAYTRKS
jgi:hypothetical protein